MKKILISIMLLCTAVVALSGCTTQTTNTSKNNATSETKPVEKKKYAPNEEAVVATKAYIEGVSKGDKNIFSDYYGEEKYDEVVKKYSMGLQYISMTNYQKAFSSIVIEYKAKSENETVIVVHGKKVDGDSLDSFLSTVPKEDRFDNNKLGSLMIEAIAEGKLTLTEGKVVEINVKLHNEKERLVPETSVFERLSSAAFLSE